MAHLVSGLVHDTCRRLRLAFATPTGLTPLSLHHTANSLARSTKSTRSSRRTPTLFKQRISGSISLPSRGTFHLSLTVLVYYRSQRLFSLGRWSSQIQAGLHVSDPTQEHSAELTIFRRRGYHPLWRPFPGSFGYKVNPGSEVLQPLIPKDKVWAVPRSLATTKGISIDFCSCGT